MSFNVQSTRNAYSNYRNGYQSGKVKDKKDVNDPKNAQKAEKENVVSNAEKKLSKAAQELLKKLQNSRSDMDFMVADFENGDSAKELLARSNKEFTVIFSNEELEKMASDEKYYAEKMQSIDGAVRMSEEINAQFGFERGFGKEGTADGVSITKFGITFNSDGSMSLFAELEKTSAKQQDRLEEILDKKAEEKKEAKKNEQSKSADTKRTVVSASSKEELLEKMNAINWDLIKADTETVGTRFDFTV